MGAMVVRNGRKLGRTPLSARVSVSAYSDEGRTLLACTSRELVTFTWDSGASTTVTGVCSQYPTVTAVRPADAPGLDKDLRVESQHRANRDNAAIAARVSNSFGAYAPAPTVWQRGFEQNLFMGPPPYHPPQESLQ